MKVPWWIDAAYRPRMRKTKILPKISFILIKPKPLGTELKNVSCTKMGVLLGIKVQEGKARMATVSDIGCFEYFVSRISLTCIFILRKLRQEKRSHSWLCFMACRPHIRKWAWEAEGQIKMQIFCSNSWFMNYEAIESFDLNGYHYVGQVKTGYHKIP